MVGFIRRVLGLPVLLVAMTLTAVGWIIMATAAFIAVMAVRIAGEDDGSNG